MHPAFLPEALKSDTCTKGVVVKGLPGLPGAAVEKLVFTPKQADVMMNFENGGISPSSFEMSTGLIDVGVPSGGGGFGDLTNSVAKRSNHVAKYLCFQRPLD